MRAIALLCLTFLLLQAAPAPAQSPPSSHTRIAAIVQDPADAEDMTDAAQDIGRRTMETIGPVPDCTLHTLSRYWGPRQYYAIDYPQCGLEPLDGWLRRDAEEAAEDARFRYREDALNAESKELCGPHPAQETSRGCALFAPNERYLSVLTDIWEYDCGMSHGLRNVRSVTFDRKTSRRVTFPDLFPDPESAKRALLPFMRASYEDIGCPDRAGLERALMYVLSEETTFTLEPDALVLYIDNYPGAAWAPPEWECNRITIPKGKAVSAGVKPRFWETGP